MSENPYESPKIGGDGTAAGGRRSGQPRVDRQRQLTTVRLALDAPLPRVCALCGKAAKYTRPLEEALLPKTKTTLVNQEKIRPVVRVPVCEQHRNFRKGWPLSILMYLPPAIALLMGLTFTFPLGLLPFLIACLTWAPWFYFLWRFLALATQIRGEYVSHNVVELRGVSRAFARACERPQDIADTMAPGDVSPVVVEVTDARSSNEIEAEPPAEEAPSDDVPAYTGPGVQLTLSLYVPFPKICILCGRPSVLPMARVRCIAPAGRNWTLLFVPQVNNFGVPLSLCQEHRKFRLHWPQTYAWLWYFLVPVILGIELYVAVMGNPSALVSRIGVTATVLFLVVLLYKTIRSARADTRLWRHNRGGTQITLHGVAPRYAEIYEEWKRQLGRRTP